MSSLFRRIINDAKLTFDRKNFANFKKNFLLLKQLVDQLTINDLNIDPELMSTTTFNCPDKAPCTYIHIYENDNISMSVFILNGNYTMPLHDHPMMYGILRGIHGKLKVQSFTRSQNLETNDGFIVVDKEPMKDVNVESESAVLTPVLSNYHEIKAIDGPAAFFDVLSPPYEKDIPVYGPRKCSFYRKITIPNKQFMVLENIPTPNHYYCDSAEFKLPPDFLKDNTTNLDEI